MNKHNKQTNIKNRWSMILEFNRQSNSLQQVKVEIKEIQVIFFKKKA